MSGFSFPTPRARTLAGPRAEFPYLADTVGGEPMRPFALVTLLIILTIIATCGLLATPMFYAQVRRGVLLPECSSTTQCFARVLAASMWSNSSTSVDSSAGGDHLSSDVFLEPDHP